MEYQQHNRNTSYGRCDSFFVESEEQGLFAQRAEAREKARVIARERQCAIAEEISRITRDEYQDDILSHMEFMEGDTLPDVNSIDIQTEIQWFMRPYLLDFLLEAHGAYQLLPETLFLAINILDRYCSRRVVYKRHYQLVGCAALLIASKYGDKKENVPTVRELKAMCCSLYSDEMFTQMEWHVLQTLDWKIGHPTIDSFLQISLAESTYDAELEHMTWYLCEHALYSRDFVSFRPSVLARSALALARYILSRSSPQSAWSSHYDHVAVRELSKKLKAPYGVSSTLFKKYQSPHLSCVSETLERFLEKQAQIARQMAMAPLTPPIIDTEMDIQKTYADPHTPQKAQQPPNMVYGYPTPPFTPESTTWNDNNYVKPCEPVCPATPTPMPPTPPTSSEHAHMHQYRGFDQTHLHPIDPRHYIQ